jgi:hypothetical protein
MSYLFEHRDEAIWEPSIEIAKLLLAEISHLESRLGVKSGLNESMSDTVDIDFDQLAGFLVALRKWANLENTSVSMLIKPLFVHLMSLLYCGDSSPEDVGRGYPDEWLNEARRLARTNMKWGPESAVV